MSCCASQLQEELPGELGARPGAGELRAEGAPAGPPQPDLCIQHSCLGGDRALLTGLCSFCINTQKCSFLAKITSSSVLFLMADFCLLPPKLAEQQ